MKLITQFDSESEADAARSLLANHGIAAFVSSRRTARLPVSYGGTKLRGLWVILDEQYADALALLGNPQHKVSNRLPPEEVERLLRETTSNDFSLPLNFLLQALLIAVCAGLLVLFLVRRFPG